MMKNNNILKKTYIEPLLSFDQIEEEQGILAGSRTDGTGTDVQPGEGEVIGDPDDNTSNSGGAKATYDFVFEYE